MLRLVFLLALSGGARADEYSEGEWRRTLDVCWVDRSCNRVMNVVHGGDWGAEYPYDSLPAFQSANNKGADAVKGDFRVSKGCLESHTHSLSLSLTHSFSLTCPLR
jgi:hypothetical protein